MDQSMHEDDPKIKKRKWEVMLVTRLQVTGGEVCRMQRHGVGDGRGGPTEWQV